MSAPTAAELREALEWWNELAPIRGGTNPSPWHGYVGRLHGAATLLVTILEQCEEMDWCEEHGASGSNMLCWKVIEQRKEFPYACRMVSSLRIPSAVVDPAKNEEAK